MTSTALFDRATEGALSRFFQVATVLVNEAGAGKTLAAVALAYRLQELTKVPVVADFRLKPPFGSYTYVPVDLFLEQLKLLAKLVEEAEQQGLDVTVEMAKAYGIIIVGKTVVLDEPYQLLDARRSNDPLVVAFGYWISMLRHFETTLFLALPHRDMLEKRARRQIRWIGSCSFNERREIVDIRFTSPHLGEKPFSITVIGHKYFEMYDTHRLFRIRSKILEKARF